MIESCLEFEGRVIANRLVMQPMEGCDCNEDGSPSELTIEKYINNAKSGAGIIWFEANAVCREGRTNPRQMQITEENLETYKALVKRVKEVCLEENGFEPILYIQLTHSGRQSIVPMIAYINSVYEERRPVTDENIVTDEYLDTLSSLYVKSAMLAYRAGFDGVDVKSCHGYLFQELLSAYTREGRYGGSFENRTRLYLDCIKAVKESVPAGFHVVTRLGVSDMVAKPNGFGTTESGEIDLTESKMLIAKIRELGVKMINITIGNPYYNPHINRPFRVGQYVPPETAETGLQRFIDVESELKREFPDVIFVGSGLSYYRNDIFEKCEYMLQNGVCDLVGFGRVSLAYPMIYRDYVNGCFDPKKCCASCSKCTILMRNKLVSGCAVFNPYYRELYKTIKN